MLTPNEHNYVAGLQPGEGLLKLDFANAFNMNFGEHLLLSDKGFQQGDPLGPLLFSASSLKLACTLTSEFDDWYLDDGSLGNHINRLLSDLEIVPRVGPTIGLVLNEMKCEIVTDDADVVASLKAKMPSTWHVQCHEAVLLGAPAGEQTAVHTVLSSELAVFHRLASRLTSLNAHDALFLLKNYFGIRCATC